MLLNILQLTVYTISGYPNIPLWHQDYFELKTTENQQRQEKLFNLSSLTE